jgi:hypothetical protein
LLSKAINSIGLGFDILGAWLLFRYALEPDQLQAANFKVGMKSGLERSTEGIKDQRISRFGIGFLAFGFALQLISNFL